MSDQSTQERPPLNIPEGKLTLADKMDEIGGILETNSHVIENYERQSGVNLMGTAPAEVKRAFFTLSTLSADLLWLDTLKSQGFSDEQITNLLNTKEQIAANDIDPVETSESEETVK